MNDRDNTDPTPDQTPDNQPDRQPDPQRPRARRVTAVPLFHPDGTPRMDPTEPLTRDAAREICRHWMRRKDRVLWELWHPGFAEWYRELFRWVSGA